MNKKKITDEIRSFFREHKKETFQYKNLPKHGSWGFYDALVSLIYSGEVGRRSVGGIPVYFWKGDDNANTA